HARVVPGRLYEVHEVDEIRLETLLQPRIADSPLAVEGLVGLREREHIRIDACAEMLEGDAQSPKPAVPAHHRGGGGEQQAVPLVERLGFIARNPVDRILE